MGSALDSGSSKVSIATVSGVNPSLARSLIDAEFRIFEKRLFELKKLRNSLATIITLPDELLLEIFSHVQKLSFNVLKEWHQITHVCQHWRNVAIGAPILWSKPVTKPHDYTLLFLARSGAAELELCLDGKIDSETYVALLPEMRRVKSIIMDHASTTVLNYLQAQISHLGENTSCLRELAVKLERQRPEFIFSGSIFGEPKYLQILQLAKLNLDWNIFPQPNLTVLYLLDVTPASPLPWGQFLHTLSELPLLEDFAVSVHALGLHSRAADIKAIRLPHLRKIFVDGCPLADIPYLISRIALPRLHQVTISCDQPQDISNADFSETARALSTLISGGDFGALNDACITFSCYSLTIEHGYPGKSVTFELAARYDDEIDENGMNARIIRTFLDGITAISRKSIVQLVLNAPLRSDEVLEPFGSLPRLESIKAYEHAAIGVVGSLKIPLSHSDSTSISFRHVQSLTLSEQQDMFNFLDYPYDRFLWEDLCDSLMQRCEYGAPIHRLSIGCYYIDREELKPLHEIVVDVDYPKPPWRSDDNESEGNLDNNVDELDSDDDD